MIMGILLFKENHFNAYENRVGEIYGDMRKDSKPALLYLSIFCLRRFLFVASVFFMGDIPLFQQFTFCILNFSYLIYLISVKPLEEPSANHMEIFNEGMILGVNYHLFLFHFFAEDPDSAYNVGWSCIGITLIMMLVNVVIVLVKTFKDIRFAIKKLIYRIRHRALRSKKSQLE